MTNRFLLVLIQCLFISAAIYANRKAPMDIPSFYQNKNVVVTGGCGFIGSHVVEKLVDAGAHVTIIDNLSTGSKENIAAVIHKVTLIIGDICDQSLCLKATQSADIIFHLAAYISVPGSVSDPAQCYLTNVDGTATLLEAARINQVKSFVFSSSAAVYGIHEGMCSENQSCNPTSPYGFSKLMGEQLCMQYRTVYKINTVILRYFNVWGPRQNPNGAYAGVVAKFSNLMEKNKPITLFGDGSQTRDFIPVQDVAKANLILGMYANNLIDDLPIYNIASGKSITLLELIEQLKEKFPGYSHKPYFGPVRPGDIQQSIADTRHYKELLRDRTMKTPIDTTLKIRQLLNNSPK